MKFKLIRELDDGQRVVISAHGSRIEAERQAQALSQFWPGVYVVYEAPCPVPTGAVPPESYVRNSRL
jgi:hypothetical protein